MGLTKALIEYILKRKEQISGKAIEKAKDCLFDYYAVAEAGAIANTERWEKYLSLAPAGSVQVFGHSKKTDGKTAALINGFNAHSLELDDGQRFAMIHLGASIISALLSAQQEIGFTGDDLLKGIVLGYETACRLSIAMQPSHKKRGFHAAGTCGTVGAAIGVAAALSMSAEQLETVLTAAAASSAGLLEIQEQSSELKPYNVGRAAMDGLTAAYMGLTDFRGPDDILNGERGFMRLFAGEIHPDKLTEWTEYYEIERIYVKPYAACRHCHSAIEAALDLRTQVKLTNVDSVIVETYQLAVKGHDHVKIEGVASAKLSMPYSVAAAFILGRADVSAFNEENVSNAEILALTNKIKVAEKNEFTSQSPGKRVAQVTVIDKEGNTVSKTVEYAKGDPENPISRQGLITKAYELLGSEADRIAKNVFGQEI